MNINTEFYDTLGVGKQASKEEIDQAYKNLAKKWHPDKNRGKEEEATKQFQKISEAYKTLSNPESRQIYDRFGKDGVGNMAQHMHGQGARGPQKCKPILHQQEVSLKDLYMNNKITATYPCKTACEPCDGTGSKSKQTHTCDKCNGMGQVAKMIRMGPMIQQLIEKCDKCHGKGAAVPATDMCPSCSGKGHVAATGSLEIDLDSTQMDWGVRIQASGKGHSLRDMIPGDVVIELTKPTVAKDAANGAANTVTATAVSDVSNKFQRLGKSDLEITVPISLAMALTGTDVMIETLDGRWLRVQLKNEVVDPKTSKLIPGEGMLTNNVTKTRGNLIVRFDIEFPATIKQPAAQQIKKALGDSPLDKEHSALISTHYKNAKIYNKLDDYMETPTDDDDDDEQFAHFGGGPPQCAQQ